MKSEDQRKQISRMLRKQQTPAEKTLWSWLRNRRFSQYKFRRQHPFGPYILDFYCEATQLNIELDGSGHGYPSRKNEDEKRDQWLEERGVKVIRFWNHQLKEDAEFVRNTIWSELQNRAPKRLAGYCDPPQIPEDD